MKRLLYAVFLFALFGPSLSTAAGPADSHQIHVSFKYNGAAKQCLKQSAYLWWHGRKLAAGKTSDGFFIPTELVPLLKTSDEKALETTLTCDNEVVHIINLPVSTLNTSRWTVSIEYPPWSNEFPIPRKGMWSTYLTLFHPCEVPSANSCDIVAARVDHSSPRAGTVDALLEEQKSAVGTRARDIAYGLAIYGQEYQQNREALVALLASCPRELYRIKTENGCDARLLDFLESLYWRDDEEMLPILFSFSVDNRHPVDDLSKFYLRVFEDQPVSIVNQLRKLDQEERQRVCNDMRLELRWEQRDEVFERIRASAPPSFDYLTARDCLKIE